MSKELNRKPIKNSLRTFFLINAIFISNGGTCGLTKRIDMQHMSAVITTFRSAPFYMLCALITKAKALAPFGYAKSNLKLVK